MASTETINRAAIKLVNESLCLAKGEKVFILHDKSLGQRRIVASFDSACRKAGAVVELAAIPENRPSSSPIPTARKAMLANGVIIAVTKKSVTHSPETTEARKAGKRGITLPGITEEIFAKMLSADADEIRKLNSKFERELKKASKARITTPSGTDIEIKLVKGRKIVCNGPDAFEKGYISNMPCGEVYLAPDERGANGKIAVDWLGKIISPKDKAVLELKNGRIAGFSHGAAPLMKLLDSAGKCGRVIAELGIGTNYSHKKPIGNVLHDEKIGGTVHIAFGQNASFGGSNSCGVHEDAIMIKPKVWLDGKRIYF